MNLSKHFTLEEMTRSDTAVRLGIDNTPPESLIGNGRRLADLLEQVRAILDAPLLVSSGYRCPELNRAVGSGDSSAHVQFLAADFRCPQFGAPIEVAKAILDADLLFDQLIYEGTWVHISADPRMRQQVLTATFAGGRAAYTRGLPA